jgi:hypothetical protein
MTTPKSPKAYVKAEYPLSDVTARIIAVAQEVYRTLGPGFEEVFYQRAMALEAPAQQLEFAREVWIEVRYKGRKLGRKRVDFVIDEVLVEIKASGYKVGLLLNFGGDHLQVKRLTN